MLATVSIAIGMALVVAAGGQLSKIGDADLRGWQTAAVVLLLIQALARAGFSPILGLPSYLPWAASGLVLSLVLLRTKEATLALCALGIISNLLVVTLNQGMPYTVPLDWPAAWSTNLNVGADGFYRPASTATWVPLLGDIVPTPLPSLVSVGDIIMGVGIAGYLTRAGVGVPHALAKEAKHR